MQIIICEKSMISIVKLPENFNLDKKKNYSFVLLSVKKAPFH